MFARIGKLFVAVVLFSRGPAFSFFPASFSPTSDLALTGTLEKAQERKADALIARARLSKHHRLLDIGFGWGGISIRSVSQSDRQSLWISVPLLSSLLSPSSYTVSLLVARHPVPDRAGFHYRVGSSYLLLLCLNCLDAKTYIAFGTQ